MDELERNNYAELCGTLAASATLLRGGRMALSGRLSLGVLLSLIHI